MIIQCEMIALYFARISWRHATFYVPCGLWGFVTSQMCTVLHLHGIYLLMRGTGENANEQVKCKMIKLSAMGKTPAGGGLGNIWAVNQNREFTSVWGLSQEPGMGKREGAQRMDLDGPLYWVPGGLSYICIFLRGCNSPKCSASTKLFETLLSFITRHFPKFYLCDFSRQWTVC